MHGDINYKPKWSESNRNCELRCMDVSLTVALGKVLRGAPGLSERPVDPFQEAVPCHHRTSTEHLDAFYKLSHALAYIAETRPEPWQAGEYVDVEVILRPRMNELARPFREAGIFKAK